jgi:hypothetical protein
MPAQCAASMECCLILLQFAVVRAEYSTKFFLGLPTCLTTIFPPPDAGAMTQSVPTLRTKPSCFISYTHSGADFQSIKAFKDLLLALSEDSIEFVSDDRLIIGDKIPDHEALIEKVDAVIIILTEQYNQRISGRTGGVCREYIKILERLSNQEDRRKRLVKSAGGLEMAQPTKFTIFPIIFGGDLDRSCPEEIKGHVAGDFTAFRTFRDKTGRIKVQNREHYESTIKQIINRINFTHVGSTESFANTYEELFNLLFLETKHELIDSIMSDKIKSEIYVKTKAFRQVLDQYSLILVGRKGSGKTTITKQLMIQNKNRRYVPIEIDVDDFNLEFVHEFNLQPQLFSDIRSLQPQVKLFRAAWKIFIYVSSMILVAQKVEKDRFPHEIYEFCNSAIETEKYGADINKMFWPLFVWSYTKASDHIDQAISGARTSRTAFYSDVARSLDETNIFRSAIPKNIITLFDTMIEASNLRILITVDGFDTNFSDFRMRTIQEFGQSEEAKIRNRLELDWLRALLHVAIELKRGRSNLLLAKKIDFCLTVPKDRFLEIRDYEKDAIVYQNKVCDIFWSGFELFLMSRKRLESLAGFNTNDRKNLIGRLREVWRSKFRDIPEVVEIDFHGKTIRMETIIYILRHTFWRPRDFLVYLGKLIAYRDELRKWGRRLTSDLVRQTISDCTWEVVRREFINEFQTYCVNIEQIIGSFRKSKQIVAFEYLENTLASVPFHLQNRPEAMSDIFSKLDFLFEIGVLGILLDKEVFRGHKILTNIIFYFSDGDKIYKSIAREQLRHQKFVLHPIFCEWLSLHTADEDMVLQYSWEYLRKNDDLLAVP